MPRFPDLETPFRKRARRLRTPLHALFDPADWTEAFAAIEHPAPEDRRLLEAALWIGEEAAALRLVHDDVFAGLAPETAIAMGVAVINNAYRTSEANRKAAGEDIPADEPVSFDYLANVRYENDHGQRMSAGDYLEASIDCLSSWIYDARRLPVSPTAEPPPAAETAYRASYHYSLRRALKQLFDEALHEGGYLDPNRAAHWLPHGRALANLQKAWIIRAETDFMSRPTRLATLWRDFTPAERRKLSLSRSVDSAEWRGDGWRGKVRRRSYLSRRPDGCAMERKGLGDCYLALFLHEKMPLAPGLTVSLLQDAWWVLTHFTRKMSAAVAMMEAPTISQQAFAVETRELCRILRASLGVSEDCARDIFAFLTFREPEAGPPGRGGNPKADKGDRGLWSAPLVAVSDSILLIPSAILEITMPVYRIESWLERGGIDDQALEHRGDRYEASCRSRLGAALAVNPDLPGVRFAAEGIAMTESFPHQTDLLFMIGNRAFVGEIKCWLTPADPHHWGRFYRVRLPDAARQANIRAAALRKRPEVLADALGIEIDVARTLEICPIVVTNLTAGFSLSYEGCRIIEADFLRYYLRSGSMGGAVTVWRGRPTAQKLEFLYDSETEASNRFDAIMADPWSLRRSLDRMLCEDLAYPRPTGGQYTIEARFRGDLTEAERLAHARMLEMAGNSAPPGFAANSRGW